jgi:hypothetical protein
MLRPARQRGLPHHARRKGSLSDEAP